MRLYHLGESSEFYARAVTNCYALQHEAESVSVEWIIDVITVPFQFNWSRIGMEFIKTFISKFKFANLISVM